MTPFAPVDNSARPARASRAARTLVGWWEYVSLPDWGIPRIKAKADTGARTCALDVDELAVLPGGRVRFTVPLRKEGRGRRASVEAAVVRRTRVRSSLGDSRERIVVRARLRIGAVEKTVEVGLVPRRAMNCRMLLGRAALSPEFLVDPGRSALLSGDGKAGRR